MKTLRQFGNLWMLWAAMIVLACSGDAIAGQIRYKVTDLGSLPTDNASCAMSVNNQGRTFMMNWNTPPGNEDSLAPPLNARDAVIIDGAQYDIGTLGGENSFMNWGEINELGQVVGYSESNVPDPNGEDVCGFGTGKICLPFVWQDFDMKALPTLGGNNGQASAINDHEQIVGTAETTEFDPGCPTHLTSLPALWEKGEPRALPTVDKDQDGEALWINDLGQAVGQTYNCSHTISHAVSWTNRIASALPDNNTGAIAYGNNDLGQIVGSVVTADGSTQFPAVWQNRTLTTYPLLGGDLGGIASGNNNRGQVVGSSWNSKFFWSHAFIIEDGVITDLNSVIPSSANLFLTMANKINERGQISGMAIVVSGPDEGNIHAFLLTPVHVSSGRSVADDVPVRPTSKVALNARQFLQRFGVGRIGN